jgi:methionine-rich copper-binding protein CopC
MRAALILTIASLAAVLLALQAPARSEGQADDAPVVTFTSPADGATVSEPPFAIQICFAEPVSTRDLHESGDFFIVTTPDGSRLGRLSEYQGDGYGVATYANNADAETSEGEWRVDYRVSSPDTLSVTEGQIVFTVDPDGEKLPQATPPRCLESGFTATPGASPSGTEPQVSPTATPEGSGTPGPTEEPATDAGDDGPDTLRIVLLVLGIASATALAVLIGYLVRRRWGQESGAPPPDDEPGI